MRMRAAERANHPAGHRGMGLGGAAAHRRARDPQSPRHQLVQRASPRRIRNVAPGFISHERLFIPARGRFRRTAGRLSDRARPQQQTGRGPGRQQR